MKRLICAICLLLIPFMLSAAVKLGINLDILALQDLIETWSDATYQVNADFRIGLDDEFCVKIPVTCTFNERSCFLEGGIHVAYYPWHKGPFIALSLIELGYVFGESTVDETVVSLNEAVIGWTIDLPKGFFIEPSVVIRDISGTYAKEYSQLAGEYPCYRSVRGRIGIGCKFLEVKYANKKE